MAITATDIQFRLSGGAANSDPNASLGGEKSSAQITDASLHNLFDIVSGAESAAGDTEYRAFYIHNAHGSLTWQASKVWIETQTPSADSSVEIAIGSAAVNATEQTVANESAAPTGVTFLTAAGVGNAITIGDIPFGEHKAVWVKRIIGASAAAYNTDSVIIKAQGDTAA